MEEKEILFKEYTLVKTSQLNSMHVHRMTEGHFTWWSNKISLRDALQFWGNMTAQSHFYTFIRLNMFKRIHGTNFGKSTCLKRMKTLLLAAQLPGYLSWSQAMGQPVFHHFCKVLSNECAYKCLPLWLSLKHGSQALAHSSSRYHLDVV